MQLCKYYPVANDRMGIIWTLSSIEGACVIEFGPAGTTHYAVEGVGSLNGNDKYLAVTINVDGYVKIVVLNADDFSVAAEPKLPKAGMRGSAGDRESLSWAPGSYRLAFALTKSIYLHSR